jgi:hypothetical protein
MNEDTSPERTITVTLTELEFGALAGAISKAMDHWNGVGGQANWLNDQIAKAWEKVLKAWFPTHDAKKMREGYETMFGPIPDDENVVPMLPKRMNSEGVWGRW